RHRTTIGSALRAILSAFDIGYPSERRSRGGGDHPWGGNHTWFAHVVPTDTAGTNRATRCGGSRTNTGMDRTEQYGSMSSPRQLSNRYELSDALGHGGMSEVHHGHDVRLDREVAVKVLRADLARDPQFQERFRREAHNAAALNHPAIVAVYDTGETDSEYGPLPYIVMEYVEGRTLRDIVKTEGPMSGKRAMEIMADVCAALDFSHR